MSERETLAWHTIPIFVCGRELSSSAISGWPSSKGRTTHKISQTASDRWAGYPGALVAPGFAYGHAVAVSQCVEGPWQGTLPLRGGRQLRIVLTVSRNARRSLTALNFSINHSPQPMRTAAMSLHGRVFHCAVPQLGNSDDGTLSADGNSIIGRLAKNTWLNFTRATKDTAWEVPDLAPTPEPMTAQDPAFAGETIKDRIPAIPPRITA